MTLGFVKISEIVSIVMAVAAFVIVAVRYLRVRKNGWGLAVSCVCYAALLTAAVICEFKMNAVDLLRNYGIMSVSLGLMLVISFRLLLSGRSVADASAGGASAGRTHAPVTHGRNPRSAPSRGSQIPDLPLNDSETVFNSWDK